MSEEKSDFSRISGYLDPLGEDQAFRQTAIEMMRAVVDYLNERGFEAEPPDFLTELAILSETEQNDGSPTDERR